MDRKVHKLLCKSMHSAFSPAAKPLGSDGVVHGVELWSGGDSIGGKLFHAVSIAPDDFIFRGRGDVSPFSKLFGIPLVLKRQNNYDHGTPGSDNQLATWLMKSPETGDDPGFPWNDPGSVLVAREDKGPLTFEQLETITAFVAGLVTEFEANGMCSKEMMTPRKLYTFFD